MKKLFTVALCLLAMGGICCVAKEKEAPYVNTHSTIVKDLNPNYAEINISVETRNKDANEASSKNAEISTAVVDGIKEVLDTKKGESVETINYNVSPQYSYKDGKSTLTGYVVSNTVKVKVRDLQSVSALIDGAMSAGANGISGLTFGYDEENTLCNELYAKATKEAFSQAQSVAKSIGSEVTGTKHISTSCSIDGQMPRYTRVMNSYGASKAMDSTPIEAGTLKIRASIDGLFYIK